MKPFVYGKAPAHGDFVARGLGDAAEAAWDQWLSGQIAQARERLGAGFETAHDHAPPWRFIAGPSALGEGWRTGAFTASIDSVGRRFVLVGGLEGLTAAEAASLGVGLCDAAEYALRRALIEGLNADALLQVLGQAEPTAPVRAATLALAPLPATDGVWWSADGLDLATGAEPPEGLIVQALTRLTPASETAP
ncbi:MAG: type VI secretion system-associated protein TagF [Caulobacteraceae bacterium]|nr:type VI secretion system-associated protein TagF [Caulobacteraceae bacterium]